MYVKIPYYKKCVIIYISIYCNIYNIRAKNNSFLNDSNSLTYIMVYIIFMVYIIIYGF